MRIFHGNGSNSEWEGGLHNLCREKSNLSQRLFVAWTNILLDYFQNLVESMPDRMKAVINVKGGPINY